MRLPAWLLLALSRKPSDPDYAAGRHDLNGGDPKQCAGVLLNSFGAGFRTIVEGRTVLDVGCGTGAESVALALLGAGRVVGIDIRPDLVRRAEAAARASRVDGCVTFVTQDAAALGFPDGAFDVVISKNSLEHYADPEGVIRECWRVLRPSGRLCVSVFGLWWSPYGSHMNFFTRVPWVNVWFSERTIMAVRARFRHDGARRYSEVEGGLNQLSLRRLERMMATHPWHVVQWRVHAVRGLPGVTRVPVVRELLSNGVTCVLEKSVT